MLRTALFTGLICPVEAANSILRLGMSSKMMHEWVEHREYAGSLFPYYHPGRTEIELTPEMCPYSKEVEEARCQDLFECLENERCQAAVVWGDFILDSNWAASQEEVEKEVKSDTQLTKHAFSRTLRRSVVSELLNVSCFLDPG